MSFVREYFRAALIQIKDESEPVNRTLYCQKHKLVGSPQDNWEYCPYCSEKLSKSKESTVLFDSLKIKVEQYSENLTGSQFLKCFLSPDKSVISIIYYSLKSKLIDGFSCDDGGYDLVYFPQDIVSEFQSSCGLFLDELTSEFGQFEIKPVIYLQQF